MYYVSCAFAGGPTKKNDLVGRTEGQRYGSKASQPVSIGAVEWYLEASGEGALLDKIDRFVPGHYFQIWLRSIRCCKEQACGQRTNMRHFSFTQTQICKSTQNARKPHLQKVEVCVGGYEQNDFFSGLLLKALIVLFLC